MARMLGDATGATPATTAGSSWTDLIKAAVPTLVAARYQDKVLAENLRRAKAGLPQLDVADFQPGVQVGVDKNTRNMIGMGFLFLLATGGIIYAVTR